MLFLSSASSSDTTTFCELLNNYSPVIVALISASVSLVVLGIKFLIEKKGRNAHIAKIKSEIEKNNAEINSIKNSYQPIVVSTLLKIQDKLVENKLECLKRIIKMKLDLCDIESRFLYDTSYPIDDSEYYHEVFWKFKPEDISAIKRIEVNYGGYFPTIVRKEIIILREYCESIVNEQKRKMSMEDSNLETSIIEQIAAIIEKFDNVIDLIRKDLHIDNTFIHKFLDNTK